MQLVGRLRGRVHFTPRLGATRFAPVVQDRTDRTGQPEAPPFSLWPKGHSAPSPSHDSTPRLPVFRNPNAARTAGTAVPVALGNPLLRTVCPNRCSGAVDATGRPSPRSCAF